MSSSTLSTTVANLLRDRAAPHRVAARRSTSVRSAAWGRAFTDPAVGNYRDQLSSVGLTYRHHCWCLPYGPCCSQAASVNRWGISPRWAKPPSRNGGSAEFLCTADRFRRGPRFASQPNKTR
jgi:hypothetical protein